MTGPSATCVRGPQGSAHTGVALTLVQACPWPSGRHAHTGPGVRGPQAVHSDSSTRVCGPQGGMLTVVQRVRGPQDGALTLVQARPWPSGRHAHTGPRAATGTSSQPLLSLPPGSSPAPQYLPQVSKCRAQTLLLPGGPASFQMWSQLFALQLQFSGSFKKNH